MIEALAGEFRLLSQVSDRPLIPLADEIALCRRHLEVMSYRVGRAFTLRADNVDGATEIPPGVLHTLVENAFTHGRFSGGEEFVLTQWRDDDADRLTLLSPPAEQAPPPKVSSGQGLAYVRGRPRSRLRRRCAPHWWSDIQWLAQRTHPSPAEAAAGMRILIVEDEATAAQRLDRLATAYLGSRLKEIVHAETVERGRKALAASRFDLVLLDLDLNGADGFEIIRGAHNAPRVIVVSARVQRAIDAFDNAVMDFVVKPVTQERLARALDRALDAAPAPGGTSLVVRSAGRIQLAPADHRCDAALRRGRLCRGHARRWPHATP